LFGRQQPVKRKYLPWLIELNFAMHNLTSRDKVYGQMSDNAKVLPLD